MGQGGSGGTGGTGGGGRVDFAQTGGHNEKMINSVFARLKYLI